MDKILVTSKLNNDLDGTASALAYSYLLKSTGKDAEAILFGPPHPETLFFIERHGLVVPSFATGGQKNWDKFILVDTSDTVGLPTEVDPNKVIESIDHREGARPERFPNAKVQNELVGAAATLIWEKCKAEKIKLPHPLALSLYGAIFHNSLNLLSSNTSNRDIKAVETLETEYGFTREIIKEMFNFIGEFTVKNLEDQIKTDITVTEKFAASQLIFSDVRQRLVNKEEAVRSAFEEIKSKNNLQTAFLTTVDIMTNENIIYCFDSFGQELITGALGVKFTGNFARRSPALLRKQLMPLIMPLVKKHLER